jgi:hypothetical protein
MVTGTWASYSPASTLFLRIPFSLRLTFYDMSLRRKTCCSRTILFLISPGALIFFRFYLVAGISLLFLLFFPFSLGLPVFTIDNVGYRDREERRLCRGGRPNLPLASPILLHLNPSQIPPSRLPPVPHHLKLHLHSPIRPRLLPRRSKLARPLFLALPVHLKGGWRQVWGP